MKVCPFSSNFDSGMGMMDGQQTQSANSTSHGNKTVGFLVGWAHHNRSMSSMAIESVKMPLPKVTDAEAEGACICTSSHALAE
jgi:hypothetical protein